MKPSIERELEAIRQMVRDLESRLKVETVPLGHRVKFGIGVQGEVPAPQVSDRGRVLGVDGWFTLTGSGGGGSATPDGHTLNSVTGVLNAEPLSGTVDARFKDLSGSINSRLNSGGSVVADGHTTQIVTGVLNAEPLSGTINARFNSLSGTINSAFISLWTGGTKPQDLSGSINSEFKVLSGTIDGHFNALSSSIVNTITVLSGGTNLAVDSYIWAGGRTSYQSGIPVIVGAFRFDPSTLTTIVGSSASIYFLASAANNLSTVSSYAQLWNVTDAYQVATASFVGTTFVDQVIGLSVNGSGNLNIPNLPKDYEVRVYLSATNGSTTFGGSMELYSTGVKATLSGVMGGGGVNTAFSASIDGAIKHVSGGRYLGRQVLTSATGTYTPTPGTTAVIVKMVAGGGGGGGANSPTGVGAAAGGNGGWYFEKYISPGNGVAITGGGFACGAAGAAGSHIGPSNGGTGGDSSIVVQGTLYTSKGGTGGTAGVGTTGNANAPPVSLAVGTSTGDYILAYPGDQGVVVGGGMWWSGNGGSSPFGGGGLSVGGDNNGNSGGVGAGGSGAASSGNVNKDGGSGGSGQIIVEEFS